jgi:hypothetical protein
LIRSATPIGIKKKKKQNIPHNASGIRRKAIIAFPFRLRKIFNTIIGE